MAKNDSAKKGDNGDVFDKENQSSSEDNKAQEPVVKDDDARELELLEKEEVLAKKEADLKRREANVRLAEDETKKQAKKPDSLTAFSPEEKLVEVKVAPRKSVYESPTVHHMPGTKIKVSAKERERLIKTGHVVDIAEQVDFEKDNIIQTLTSEEDGGPKVIIGASS